MRARGLDMCDSTRLARTVGKCGQLLLGLSPQSDLAKVGIQLFLIAHDDPLGASIGDDASTKFSLPQRPPHSLFTQGAKWRAIFPAASEALRRLTRVARTVEKCCHLLRGLSRGSDLAMMGVQLFRSVHDYPLGAAIGRDPVEKFALPERPPHEVVPDGSWLSILPALSTAVRRLPQQQVDILLALFASRRSYYADYIADVLAVHFHVSQHSDDGWETIEKAFRQCPGDPWMVYALCICHAQAKMLFGQRITYESFIEDLLSARSTAESGKTPLHVHLLSAVSRRAYLIMTTLWCCSATSWVTWRQLFYIADSVAGQYLRASPPDGVDRSAMLEIRIICNVLRHGAPDLSKIKGLTDEYRAAEKYATALYGNDRTIDDTNYASYWFLEFFEDGGIWEDRLKPYLRSFWEYDFDNATDEPSGPAALAAVARRSVAKEGTQMWFMRLSSQQSVDFLSLPHPIFDRLMAARHVSHILHLWDPLSQSVSLC